MFCKTVFKVFRIVYIRHFVDSIEGGSLLLVGIFFNFIISIEKEKRLYLLCLLYLYLYLYLTTLFIYNLAHFRTLQSPVSGLPLLLIARDDRHIVRRHTRLLIHLHCEDTGFRPGHQTGQLGPVDR